MSLFDEEESIEEFDSETNIRAKAFIVYGDIHDSEGILTLLREMNLLEEPSITSDKSGAKIKGDYSVKFDEKNSYTWMFKSYDAKKEDFKSFYNTLLNSPKIYAAWLSHNYFEEAKQDLSDRYTLDQIGFSLRYYPQIGIDNFTKITLMVYSKDSGTYYKLLKQMFSEKMGVYLKDSFMNVLITSLNPDKTGRVYLNEEFGISLFSGNTYDIFNDISDWGYDMGWKLLNSASEYSWFRVANNKPELKERRKKHSLVLSLSEIESKKLYSLTGVNDVKTLFTQYFTPIKEKDLVRFPGQGRQFIAPVIEEYKDQTVLRLLNFRKGETIVMSIDEKDYQLEIYPTNLTKPWTIINLCKEINDIYPANVEGFP